MPKKVDGFDVERREVLNTIFKILGIDENNKEICLNDIDNEPDKIEQISELETEIKKYFLTGLWSAYKGKQIKRRWFSIVRSILKEFNITYKTMTHRETVFQDNKSITTTKLRVIIEI